MTCANWANAEVAQSKNDELDKNIQVAAPKLQAPAIQPKTNNEGSVSMTKEELARHPDLIVRGMIPSVLQNNEEAVSLLLPLYRELPKKDPVLLSWAEAIDARHKATIVRLRNVIVRYSPNTLIVCPYVINLLKRSF